MNTKSTNDACHDHDENKSKEQLKEMIQLIQKNDIKNLRSWMANYNDSKTVVCAVLCIDICFETLFW